jgi:hypothetical protein
MSSSVFCVFDSVVSCPGAAGLQEVGVNGLQQIAQR